MASALAVFAAALTGCTEDPVLPPMVVPTCNWKANMTIAEFKSAYWDSSTNGFKTVGVTENGSNIYIAGRVISQSASGNIYNSIVLQDETGAVNISVVTKNLTQTFNFGQQVVIDATALSAGMYNNLFQLGAPGTSSAGAAQLTFIQSADFEAHAGLNGLANPQLVDTLETDIPTLLEAQKTKEGMLKYQSQLVRIKNVKFEEPGQPFAGSANTNRYFKDEQGNRLMVRTSAYATFHDSIVPGGKGDVTAILSFYGKEWQLMLNDIDGLQGFTPFDPNAPIIPSDAVTSIDANFESGALPDGWTQVQAAGNKAWYVASFNNTTTGVTEKYAAMTGYKGTAPFDQWLLSAPIDMSKVTDKSLTFDNQVNGYASTTTQMEVYVLDSANPANAKIKDKLTFTAATAPASGYSGWVNSGKVDLSKYTGIIFVAFRYTATQDANYATWCVDNVKVNVK